MRENPSKTNSMETLSLSGFQTPYADLGNGQKQMLFSVSSNVYYGYHQPLTSVQNGAEPMHTEDLNKPCEEMDIVHLERPFVNRKRTRNSGDITWDNCKKRRQNDLQRPCILPQRCSSLKVVSDEDLLRETHGCSYYHWVASNL